MNDKILTIKKSTLVDIANQVRAKTGSTDLIKVADLDDAVAHLSSEVTKTWNDVDVNRISDAARYYVSKDKKSLYRMYEDKEGIYHKNLITGEITEVYPYGYDWNNFKEMSNGCIYVSDYNDNVIYINNKIGTLITELNSDTPIMLWEIVEAENGNIYATLASYNEETDEESGKIILLNGSTYNTLYEIEGVFIGVCGSYRDSNRNDYIFVYSETDSSYDSVMCYKDGELTMLLNKSIGELYEDSKGNLYACGDGLYHIDINTQEVTILYENGSIQNRFQVGKDYKSFFETKSGDLYLGSYFPRGSYEKCDKAVFYLNGVSCTPIIDNTKPNDNNGYGFDIFYEAKNGDVYLSASRHGVYKLNKSSATKIIEFNEGTKHEFNTWYETKNGDVYLTATYRSGEDSVWDKGLYYVSGDIVDSGNRHIIYNGYFWDTFIETESGDIYVVESNAHQVSTKYGVYHLNKEIATRVLDYQWQFYFVTDTADNVYATGSIVPEFVEGEDLILYKLNGAEEPSIVIYVEV